MTIPQYYYMAWNRCKCNECSKLQSLYSRAMFMRSSQLRNGVAAAPHLVEWATLNVHFALLVHARVLRAGLEALRREAHNFGLYDAEPIIFIHPDQGHLLPPSLAASARHGPLPLRVTGRQHMRNDGGAYTRPALFFPSRIRTHLQARIPASNKR
ncbi:hypothetical protein CALVIDRAFT_293105 [Calocera viscosa TUFC12733]|uniref:Uncharacterized protein n=1 Tax=Calocera viscosa (strain TUFC12733) TaxID=1330018 RepID=A0A167IM22_CALVF|nr:hypothetical protein CALVIDRAFT_293105 [Calocera viscosa TUFC12733]